MGATTTLQQLVVKPKSFLVTFKMEIKMKYTYSFKRYQQCLNVFIAWKADFNNWYVWYTQLQGIFDLKNYPKYYVYSI